MPCVVVTVTCCPTSSVCSRMSSLTDFSVINLATDARQASFGGVWGREFRWVRQVVPLHGFWSSTSSVRKLWDLLVVQFESLDDRLSMTYIYGSIKPGNCRPYFVYSMASLTYPHLWSQSQTISSSWDLPHFRKELTRVTTQGTNWNPHQRRRAPMWTIFKTRQIYKRQN